MITADLFNDLIGIPWKMHGRDKTGMDCFGLFIEVQGRLGVEVPDPIYLASAYTADAAALYLEQGRGTGWQEVKGAYRTGDAILMQDPSFNLPYHVGVLLPDGKVIHATARYGVVLSAIQKLSPLIITAYRRPA